ncbi:MAG: VCBS repeat-containing protein [Deltaproteobacteria bacterium]
MKKCLWLAIALICSFLHVQALFAGTGHFNNDGLSDILWRNTSTGQAVLWFMNADGTHSGQKTLLTNPNWTIAGTGYFNGDGLSDILWRNTSTGQVVLGFMNADGTQSGSKALLTNPDWTIAGTGYFNSGGISDILWRNISTGQVFLWFMNTDGTRSGYKTLLNDPNWTAAGTGYFNGDGLSDILWRNTSTGQVVIWFMNANGTHTSHKTLLVNPNWTIAGTGFFNGDGISDILWRDASTGQAVLGFMNADGTQSGRRTLLTNLNWNIYPLYAIPDVISFVTGGNSFSPVLVVYGSPEILWTWADGTTSSSPAPTKNYGSPGKRLNTLSVKPWSAVRRINIGYDAGDGGSGEIEYVADQHVSSVQGLELVAPYLAQWCSSYNELTSLNFISFTNLDTIECYLSQTLNRVHLANTPKLRRACFEDCNLASLDLSGSPLLEDLRGAQNNYPTITFGAIGSHVWHICVRDNPQLSNQTIFSDMTRFPNLSEFFIWNDNQTGNLRIPATSPTNYVSLLADGNHYTSLNLSGALANSLSQGTVSFRNNSLSSIDITGCSQITDLFLENNNLAASQLDTLLTTLDALERGSVNANSGATLTVDLRGNADPGSVGYAHAQSLAVKGWTILATGWSLSPPPPENNGETRIDFRTSGDATGMRCDFLGTDTVATWHWSDGTTSPAASGAGAVKSGLGSGSHDHYLVISNGAALTRFGASDGGQGRLISMTGFEKCTHLAVVYAYNESNLSVLGRTNTTITREYHLMGTGLSTASMDQIFADAAATGVANGTMWCSNQGTSASDGSRATLVSRGWSLY